jgi:hypothetical protein
MDEINVDVIVSNGTNVEVNSPSTSVNAFVNLPPPLESTTDSPSIDYHSNVILPGPQGPPGIQGPVGPQGPQGNISGINNLNTQLIYLSGQDGLNIYTDNYNTIFISGNSGYFQSLINTTNNNLNITGNTLATNLSSTGITLQTNINTISSNLNTTGNTLQTNINTLTTNLATTGSTLQTNINTLTTNLATTGNTLATNLATTGSTLQTNINTLTTNLATTGNTLATNLATTGSTLQTNINTLTTNLATTGSTLQTNINTLTTNLATTGSTLQTNINTLTTNLATTGSTLQTNIDTLTTNLATTGNTLSTNLATTGSTLQTNIDTLSNKVIYTTGNQIKSGRLAIGDTILDASYPYELSLQSNHADTWLEILNHSGANQGIFFGIQDNDLQQWNYQGGDMLFFTSPNHTDGNERLRITNSGRIGIGTSSPSEKLQVAGNIKASGASFDNRPTVNGTGVLLNGEAAALVQNVVYTTGNQTISGNKTFINNIGVQGTGIFNALDLSNISEFNFSGTDINLINGNVNISGGTAYISGNPVLTGVNLTPYATVANLNLTGANLDFLKENHIIETRSFALDPFVPNYLSGGRNAYTSFTFNGPLPSFDLRLPGIGTDTQTGDKLYLSMTTPSTTSVLIYTPQPGPGWGLYTTVPPSTNFIQAFYVSSFVIGYPLWTPMKNIMGYLDSTDSININARINTLSGNSVLKTGTQIIDGNKTFNNTTYFNSGVSLQNSYVGKYLPAVSSASTFTNHWFIDTASTGQQEMWLNGISGSRALTNLDNSVWGVNLNIIGIRTGYPEPVVANYNLNFVLARRGGGGETINVYNPTVISSGSSADNPFQIASGFYHSTSGFFIQPVAGTTTFRLLVTPSSSTRTLFKVFGVINSLSMPIF